MAHGACEPMESSARTNHDLWAPDRCHAPRGVTTICAHSPARSSPAAAASGVREEAHAGADSANIRGGPTPLPTPPRCTLCLPSLRAQKVRPNSGCPATILLRRSRQLSSRLQGMLPVGRQFLHTRMHVAGAPRTAFDLEAHTRWSVTAATCLRAAESPWRELSAPERRDGGEVGRTYGHRHSSSWWRCQSASAPHVQSFCGRHLGFNGGA